jgi:hypothetical protein
MRSANGFTLQDQVKEYVDLGWSVLPLRPKGKEPLTEALPSINGHASWKPYQTQPVLTDNILSWFADHNVEMGGAGLNIGLVTGYGSLYVLDFDTPQIPARSPRLVRPRSRLAVAGINTTSVLPGWLPRTWRRRGFRTNSREWVHMWPLRSAHTIRA